MPFNEIIGHPEIIKALESSLETNKTGHAYLLTGPAGVGKKTLARSFARRLLCPAGQDNIECCCESCKRFRNESHPDFKIIVPQGNSIKIEQLREIQHQAYLSPVMGRKKVYFFPDAEKLTDVAANSFLKLLEEAPSGVVFIFTAVRTDNILPTIRSRCQLYQLFPVSAAEIAAGLERMGIPRDEAFRRSESCQGLPGVAISHQMKSPVGEGRAFSDVTQASLLELFKLADELDKQERKEVVALLLEWQSDLRKSLLKICSSSKIQSFGTAVAIIEKLTQVIMMSEYNVNIRALMEEFFIWLKLENA